MDQMALRRMVGAGWKSFIRGGAVSAATVVVMTVTLVIIGALIFLSSLLTFTLDSIRDNVVVSVYFVTTPALSSSGASIIDRINYEQNRDAIEQLTKAIGATRDVGLAVVIVFALASILIAFATIRLAIYTAKDEIGVMRLVGASNAYIRGPFIVAGVITGVLATLIVLILLFPAAWYGGAKTASWLGGFNLLTYDHQTFFFIFIILLASGIFLGGAASVLAIRRYLKV